MRFSTCLQRLDAKGFYILDNFVSYRRRFVGFKRYAGYGEFLRKLIYRVYDGRLKRGRFTFWRSRPTRRMHEVAFFLIRLAPPHINFVSAWAWAILRLLRNQSWRGKRYRLGLPAHGQRSRSNAASAGRNRDMANLFVLNERWVYGIGQARKHVDPAQAKKKQHRPKQQRTDKAKQIRGKSVVRSKTQKKDIWR